MKGKENSFPFINGKRAKLAKFGRNQSCSFPELSLKRCLKEIECFGNKNKRTIFVRIFVSFLIAFCRVFY